MELGHMMDHHFKVQEKLEDQLQQFLNHKETIQQYSSMEVMTTYITSMYQVDHGHTMDHHSNHQKYMEMLQLSSQNQKTIHQ
jgi:hypothetical protein